MPELCRVHLPLTQCMVYILHISNGERLPAVLLPLLLLKPDGHINAHSRSHGVFAMSLFKKKSESARKRDPCN